MFSQKFCISNLTLYPNKVWAQDSCKVFRSMMEHHAKGLRIQHKYTKIISTYCKKCKSHKLSNPGIKVYLN